MVNIFPEVFSLGFHVDRFMSRAGIVFKINLIYYENCSSFIDMKSLMVSWYCYILMWICIFLFWYRIHGLFSMQFTLLLVIVQLLFLQIVVDSLLDPKVGIIYDPKSLIRALADLIERYMKSQVNGLIDTRW
jgi:hypothetical protein